MTDIFDRLTPITQPTAMDNVNVKRLMDEIKKSVHDMLDEEALTTPNIRELMKQQVEDYLNDLKTKGRIVSNTKSVCGVYAGHTVLKGRRNRHTLVVRYTEGAGNTVYVVKSTWRKAKRKLATNLASAKHMLMIGTTIQPVPAVEYYTIIGTIKETNELLH